MRNYGSVQVNFWGNESIQNLNDQAKLLALYLQTGPHTNMLGCFRLPDGYITEDLKWKLQTVKESFVKLIDIAFLTRDARSSWIIIHEFLKWNPIQNPKQGVGIQKLFDAVPRESIVFKPLLNSLLTYGKYLNTTFSEQIAELNGFDTVPSQDDTDKYEEQEQDQYQYQEQDQDQNYLSGKPDLSPFSFNQKIQAEKNINKLIQSDAIEALEFLNEKTGRSYRAVDTNLKLIIARLKSGASLQDCKQIIAKKTREWKGNEKMAEYLRPATLFNAEKFEQYMGELVLPELESSHDAN